MKVYGISDHERKVVIFKKQDDGKIKIYSKALKQKFLTYEEFRHIRSTPRTSKYILVKYRDDNKLMESLSMKKQYKLFIKEAKLLKRITGGKLNLFKTGKPATTILDYFNKMKPKEEPEPIELYEHEILEKCSNSALIFTSGSIKLKEYKGMGYRYDFVSQFPSIISSNHFQIPMTKGKLTTITEEEFNKMKFFKYGCYHVKIESEINKKLLITNKDNWYTHIDLNRAIELKYKLTIIENGKPNALLYDKFMNASKMFCPTINNLFNLKTQGFKVIKKYINPLWGKLCQNNVMTITLSPDNSEVNYDKWIVKEIKPINDLKCTVNLISREKPYETNYARIKPFIIAKSRYMLSKVIEQNEQSILWAHTDGVILDKPISKETKLGDNLGELQFKNSGQCRIKNVTNYEFYDDVEPDLFDELKKQKKLAKKLFQK